MAEYIDKQELLKNFCGYDLTRCKKHGNETPEQQSRTVSRGSKKSKTAALNMIYRLLQFPESSGLCVRRYSNTLRDSVFSDLKWAIHRFGLDSHFECTVSPMQITRRATGQKILFRGLDDALKITSISVDRGAICWVWVEEAYEISSEDDFNKLDMSIRGEKPEGYFKQITLTFNPWSANSWLKARFFDKPDDDVFTKTTTWQCNEWLDDSDRGIFLKMKENNPRRYGRSHNEAAKALEQYVKKGIKNAEYCARRVIITETAYFSSLSQRDGLLELDCEWYEIDLPLDARSCPLCRDMNGRRFKLSEFEVGATAPPFHPNCANGAIIPYFDDDFDIDMMEREGARDISEDISCGEWEKKFVGGGLTTSGNDDIIKSESDLKKIIGEHSIESDLKAVNPNFSMGGLYQMNCVNCAIAYELRRRGYDVEARSSSGVITDEIFKMFDGFKYLGYRDDRYRFFSKADIIADIVETAKGWGNNARGIVNIQFKHTNAGHFISIEVENGQVRFIDPQEGVDAKGIFDKADILKTVFGRVDGLMLKESVLSTIENKLG